MKRSFWLVATAAVIAMPTVAQAQDADGIKAGDKLFRVRAIWVAPLDNSGGINPTFPDEEVKVDSSVMPEVDFTYMATDHLGFELIAATTKHRASGKSGTTGSIGKLASTWVLPPTLTAQYHFNPAGKVRPYVGVGVNYTVFYSEDASSGLESAVGPTKVSLSNSFGPAVQAGVDVAVGKNSFINFDVKWVDMDTTATLKTTAIGTQKVRVHIDPLIVGAGFGWRF